MCIHICHTCTYTVYILYISICRCVLPFSNQSCAHHPSHHACQRSSPQWHHLVSTKMSQKIKESCEVTILLRGSWLGPKTLQNISFHRYFKPIHPFSVQILLLYSVALLHKKKTTSTSPLVSHSLIFSAILNAPKMPKMMDSRRSWQHMAKWSKAVA